MLTAYRIVLLASAAAIVALVGWRLAHLRRGPRPPWGRLLNEWAWTLIPLLVVGELLWRSLSVAK